MPSKLPPSSAALFAVAGLVAACQPEPRNAVVENAPVNEVRQRPPLPVAEPPMDRAALLLAAARAGSAAALGKDDAEAQRRLDGKRFEIRIRFGCPAAARPGAAAGPFSVRFTADDRTLRIRATPDLTLDNPEIEELATGTIEAVEGFWMYRPWLLADGCPLPPPAPAPDAPGPEEAEAAPEDSLQTPAAMPTRRVGIAQFFTTTDPRTGRLAERAYEATKLLGPDERPSMQGYNLVLSGRLRQLPGGPVISCRVADAAIPPNCVASAQLDRVWIENPETKDVLAQWNK